MYRGTTPTLTFTLPFEASDLDILNIAFCQVKALEGFDPKIIFEKTLADCTISGKSVKVNLSESDTLKLGAKKNVEIQLRAAVGDKRMASKIFSIPVESILKDGVLT